MRVLMAYRCCYNQITGVIWEAKYRICSGIGACLIRNILKSMMEDKIWTILFLRSKPFLVLDA